jgi:signal transduction histidine kinase
MPESIILIVDDDRTIVRFCQRLLEKASFRVITALKPVDALRILEEQKVDLLLSDIRMPVMDGFELISRAKQFQPGLPVLVMTGFGSVDTAIQALHRGVDGLILKPFENSTDLVQAVQRVISESRARQDAARLQVLRPLFDVSETLLAETSPQSLEILILDAIENLFQASSAGIFRWVQSGVIEPVRVTEDGMQKASPFESLTKLLHMAVTSRPAQVINAAGPGIGDLQAAVREMGWESALVAEVKRNDQQFVFYAGRRTVSGPQMVYPRPFAEPDVEMFVILARQSAVALENARLYSELKDNVRRVEESQRALVQAEKMAAVGRLMASLAHEINNPLQAVRNCLHLASRRTIDNEQRFTYLEMSHSELERLVTTVRRMLDFYRTGRGDLEVLDLDAMISRVLALLELQLVSLKINVYRTETGKRTKVMGIPDQIQQVVFNLILNAMDALESVEGVRQIWIDVVYQEQNVIIYVEDSGPGILQDVREQIFEPFVSTKKSGTGLGLAVSYGIIEGHKGSLVVVQPRYGHGACFEASLPVMSEE